MLYNYPFWKQNVSYLNGDLDGKRKFYRARVGFYDKIIEVWAPPASSVNSVGRANYRNQSILYCTDSDIYSCLLELVDRTHHRIQALTIIEFELEKNFKVIPLGITDRKNYDKLLSINRVDYDYQSYQLISNFIDNEFRLNSLSKERNYLNSSALSNIFLADQPDALGIRYKTVQQFNFAHAGLNYSFCPNRISSNYIVTNALFYEFKWFDSEEFQFNHINTYIGTINNSGDIDYVKNV